jgi:uncharacterized repeat protein (TIGR01451 family)
VKAGGLSGTLGVVVAVLLCCVAGPYVESAAAAPGVAWSLNVVSNPTMLSRMGEGQPSEEIQEYIVTVTNVGSEASTGPISVADTLPTGIDRNPFGFLGGTNRVAAGGFGMVCSATGQIATCEGSESVVPGESLAMYISVLASETAPAEVTDVVEVSGGGGALVRQSVTTPIGSTPLPFGLNPGPTGFTTSYVEEDEGSPSASGSHPYQVSFGLNFNTTILPNFELYGVEQPKTIGVTLPRGMYADPGATAVKCTEAELETDKTEDPSTDLIPGGCPQASQVGVATTIVRLTGFEPTFFVTPVYNMVAPPGQPAAFGFDAAAAIYVHLFGHVNSAGEYELSAKVPDTPAKVPIVAASVSLWGDPTDGSHDAMRGLLGVSGGEAGSSGCIGAHESQCPTARLGKAFVTLPSDCPNAPLISSAELSSWQNPGAVVRRESVGSSPQGPVLATTDCGSQGFSPEIQSKAESPRADSPSGFQVDIHQPQDQSFASRATANLRDATVTLPEGVAVNPSSANGLGVCSEGEIGYLPDASGRLHFSEEPQSCPNSAKIGTLEVNTPLLEHPLSGGVFVAAPFENPFGSLLAIYFAIEDEEAGFVAKLAGKVIQNKRTGQLTATFTENPELPVEDIDVHLFPGDTASLKTSLTCGSYTTTSTLVPWSAPEGIAAQPTTAFATNVAARGSGACPTTESGAPFAPRFTAGTVTSSAGAYSPFVLNLAREDGEQHITAIDTTLPKGLLGKPAGIPYCTDAEIADARAREAPRQGAAEEATPSCPAATKVGTVTVGAGAGPSPYFVHGHAYWAGPYKGAPLSVVIIAPAVAGPFDLGTVVTRVALHVEEFSAQVHAVSDPLPTILEGIPLDLRSIALNLNRPDFILNPTSCREKQITGNLGSQAGKSDPLLNRFQAVGCNKLDFKPTLKLSLSGPTKRTGHPALKAVVTYPKQGAYSNIARAQVSLPHSEFLDQGNLDKVCTQPQLRSATCPTRSIYGYARAWSPLLARPLEGPVFLGVGFGDKLPDLVAELDGQIRVLLKGKVDTDGEKGIRNTFEAVPDAPVSRFELRLKGGKKYGLLENSENICSRPQRALTRFSAQNEIVNVANVPIGNNCGTKNKKNDQP